MESNKKDTAKEKIIIFVIGTLLGAVISTSAFLICVNTLNMNNNNNNGQTSQMRGGGTPPEMPSGENGPSGQNGQPPAKPGEDNSQNNS
jgi:hypothetical protein